MKPLWAHLRRSLDETLHGSRDVFDKTTKRDGITIEGLVLDLDLALVFHIPFPLIRKSVESRRHERAKNKPVFGYGW